MSSSKSSVDDLGDSWVDVTAGSNFGSQGISTPASVTRTLCVEDYLRLLREAQESIHSSTRVSSAGSRRDSPRSSPKSPPNSPVQCSSSSMNLEWQSYFVNSDSREDEEFQDDWSSRPDQLPPKNWSFRPSTKDSLSLRHARVGNTNVFSRKGMCTLFLSNLISLILGAGVGLWLSKHFIAVPAIKVR